jgi:hypothetical protein
VVEVAIEAVGARGDGIGRLGGERVYVPLALPGDRLRVRLEARRGGDGWVGAGDHRSGGRDARQGLAARARRQGQQAGDR